MKRRTAAAILATVAAARHRVFVAFGEAVTVGDAAGYVRAMAEEVIDDDTD